MCEMFYVLRHLLYLYFAYDFYNKQINKCHWDAGNIGDVEVWLGSSGDDAVMAMQRTYRITLPSAAFFHLQIAA